ncbi:MAG: NADase-type glycan-binding domain-containing protein [Egibacteraceae bacterium]
MLNGVAIVNGYGKSADLFNANARIQTATITTAAGSKDLILSDTSAVQVLAIPSGPTTFLRLKINSVFAGTRHEDLLVSEVQFTVAGTAA